jgi:hypothetical protein
VQALSILLALPCMARIAAAFINVFRRWPNAPIPLIA